MRNARAAPRSYGWTRPVADDGRGRFLTRPIGSASQLRAQRRIPTDFPFNRPRRAQARGRHLVGERGRSALWRVSTASPMTGRLTLR